MAGEFAFLCGSIGRVAADRLVTAIERATAEGIALLAAPNSGGTRMQEGTPAFVQMIRISAAIAGRARRVLGPRVYEALHGHPFPEGVQTAENLYVHGIVDAVVPPEEIGDVLHRAVEILLSKPVLARTPDRSTRRSPMSTPGRRSPGRDARTGSAYAGCCGSPRPT